MKVLEENALNTFFAQNLTFVIKTYSFVLK